MTDHADLSRRLALAIGWKPKQLSIAHRSAWHYPDVPGLIAEDGYVVRWFDYRDPNVWGPVLEWLIREHEPDIYYDENAFMIAGDGMWIHASTLAEAVARAAIAVGGE